jgi:hydroxymethylglutaryl-CoA lyase
MNGIIKLVECPRDAMQGWKNFIPAEKKISYLESLLAVGFDTIDCGSFVSAKAIPQMADTAFVLKQTDTSNTISKLLCIVANERGALEASNFSNIDCLGFPFSISPTFQQRNTNSTIHQSWERVLLIRDACVKYNKELVIYLSMGFGNPYGDPYHEDILFEWADKLIDSGIRTISVADTVGLATAEQVSSVMNALIPRYPAIEIGVHLHSTITNWKEKIDAALHAGCIRFDGALKGIGGCPMANDELVGNMDTELMIPYFQSLDLLPPLNMKALSEASLLASAIFS